MHAFPLSDYSCPSLQSIPKALLSLNSLATPIDPLIRQMEFHRHQTRNDNHQATADHSRHYSWVIFRRVLVPEYRTPYNPTDATEAHKRSRAEGSLPLPADVIRLIRQHGGDISITRDRSEEDPEIPDSVVRSVSEEWKADESQHSVADDDGCADVILVSDGCAHKHDDCGCYIRRSDEALGFGDGETHSETEDHGEEVGDCVGVYGG